VGFPKGQVDEMHLQDFDAHRAFICTDSADISYVDVGEGPAALFLHGVGTNAYLWRNVIAELTGTTRCIALDLPLHGQSPARADQDFSLSALADVVAEFCERLGIDDINLVAHDTGGAIAQIFAATHPDRLQTLTLTNCDTQDNIPPEAFKPTVELAKAGGLAPEAPTLLGDLGAARAAVFADGYEDPALPTDDMVRAFLEPVIGTPTAAKQFERLLSALEPHDLVAVESALARLEVPTLIVWGSGDEFFDVCWAYWLRDTIPGVTDVIEVDGAKLFFPDERAHELVPHLLRHWAAADEARRSRRTHA
jgi:pimeloyl-ACP methyl ester carboxylesterase